MKKRDRPLWLAFSGDTPESAARARFVQRFNQEPQKLQPAGPILLAGPIPEKNLEKEIEENVQVVQYRFY